MIIIIAIMRRWFQHNRRSESEERHSSFEQIKAIVWFQRLCNDVWKNSLEQQGQQSLTHMRFLSTLYICLLKHR